MKTDFVKSKITGGHYGFVAPRSGKVFVNKMTECMLIQLRPDDVVADIGAYVGEYSMYAASQGVKRVMSYEASPVTFEVLKKNKRDVMDIHNLAVVGNDDPNVELFISTGVGASNSIAKTKGISIIVPAIKYEDAVKDATVAKIDVEGAEYGYNIIQPQLRAITLEFHPIVKVDWKSNAEKIMSDLEANGYKCLKRPQFPHGWDIHGTWSKDD